MVNNPASNFGIMMMLENEVYYHSRNYASTDHSNSALHPRLVITYTTPITDPLRSTLDGVFANVDKSQIATGLLDEYATPLVPMDVFNGVLSDSNNLVFNT